MIIKPPIIVMSFARPDYLKPVLQSLALNDLTGRSVHLFQDGAVNEYSGERRAPDEPIQKSVQLFKEIIPDGTVHESKKNLGICENFLRAERFAFETLDADTAYFFEDDLVLSPHYLETMDNLHHKLADRPEIAYFAAYGNHLLTLEQQMARKTELERLAHHWAFGLRKSHWLEMTEFLKPYYEIVCGRDYNHKYRNNVAIREWHKSIGAAHPATSQDGNKALATALLGRWRAGTVACWAKYIGEKGEHWTPELYAKQNFSSTTMISDPMTEITIPSQGRIEELVRAEKSEYVALATSSPTPVPAIKPPALKKPQMLLTETERALLQPFMRHCRTYVEFGSGGSTCFVSDFEKDWIISVDSSPEWFEKIKLATADSKTKPELHLVDLGATGAFGMPTDPSRKSDWPKYHESIWLDLRASHADLYFVDGRFRVACAMQCLLHCQPGAFIAIHDFNVRPHYHVVKQFLREVASAEQLSIFVREDDVDVAAAIRVLNEYRFTPD